MKIDLGGSGAWGCLVVEAHGNVAAGGRVVSKRMSGRVFSESLRGDP